MQIDSIMGKQDIVWSPGLTAKDAASAMEDILGYEGAIHKWDNEGRRFVGEKLEDHWIIDRNTSYIFVGRLALVDA